ncbi:Alanyl-tRNA synthetase [Azospirillaceae bacterium]
MRGDHALTPKEAVRLTALGLLRQNGAMRYADLAFDIRRFTGNIMGPSLDLMGLSLEMLRYEDLIVALDGQGMEDNALLELTPQGRREFDFLMQAPVRVASSDLFHKLITALKLRFLHLLTPTEQQGQVAQLIAMTEAELSRATRLLEHHAADSGVFPAWLAHDCLQIRTRLAWFQALAVDLCGRGVV